jgi:hypothetical protein
MLSTLMTLLVKPRIPVNLLGCFGWSLIAAGCGAGWRQTGARPIDSRTIVFSARTTAASVHYLAHCGQSDLSIISGTRDLRKRDIRGTRHLVMQALASALDTTTLKGQEHRYLLQYFGMEINGRPVVLVNGVHESLVNADTQSVSRTEPISICDVGLGAFQAWVDEKERRVGDIRFDPGWTS